MSLTVDNRLREVVKRADLAIVFEFWIGAGNLKHLVTNYPIVIDTVLRASSSVSFCPRYSTSSASSSNT